MVADRGVSVQLCNLKNYSKMKIRLVAIVCFLVFAGTAIAQKNDDGKISVEIGFVDAITYDAKAVKETSCYLMNEDSVVIDSAYMNRNMLSETKSYGAAYYKVVPGKKYIACFTNPKYQTLYVPFTAKLPKGEYRLNLGWKHLMRRKPMEKTLGAATVKATKVKFYMKGDTVVYNADAFQLENGSMLDAIIRQLPGVELKDGGEITVNGKKVDELLLNGKDFFSHDRQIMLENLPAYMVKDIKVYERQSERSKFFKDSLLDIKKPYVMDVNLKREYSIGYIANAEVGGGTKDRYLARLFAMRFTPQSRVSFFGLMNNVNDSRRPGQSGDWSPASSQGSGLVATRKAAADYSVDDKGDVWHVKGGAEISRQDADDRSFSNSTTFLSGGDTYGLSHSNSRSYNTSFQTNHELRIQKGVFFTFSPSFSYQNNRNHSLALASALGERVYRNGRETLDSIFSPLAGDRIRDILINRSRQMGLGRSHNSDLSGSAGLTFKVPVLYLTSDINLSGSYSDGRSRNFSQQKTDYYRESTPGPFRNYYSTTPSNAYSYSASWNNSFRVTRELAIVPSYSYSQGYNSARRDLFSFDRLGNETLLPFGSLPSTTDSMEMARNARDSYNSMQTTNNHRAGIRFDLYRFIEKEKTNHNLSAQLSMPVNFRRDNIRYHRDGKFADVSKHYTLFSPSLSIWDEMRLKGKHDDEQNDFRNLIHDIRLGTTVSAPGILYFVPWYKDETDPMNIFVGNTGLKPTRTYNASYQMIYRNFSSERNWHWDINYTITHNAVAVGREFDRNTGIRTARPDNVNGNWSVFGGGGYNTPLDKKKRWSLSSFTIVNYTNSVDLAGSDDRGVYRSDVHNFRLSENLTLALKLKNMRIAAVGGIDWLNATSHREGFKTVNVENFKYGLNYNCNLPHNFDISTDLMMYSRRGYDDKGMNSDDFVWNARISKGIMGSSLVISAEGFDILHNLSAVTRSLNAQGRVETYSNVIPRYFMFHLTYRLNLKPKKRPGDE